MLTSDFDYNLPPDRIARDPVVPRDHSRLMHLRRKAQSIGHQRFYKLPDLLREGDVLVLNDTKVIPARLYGALSTGGKVEVLLLDRISPDSFRVMAKPGAKFKPGRIIGFGEGMNAEVIEVEEDGCRVMKFSLSGDALMDRILAFGETPLPPYIKNSSADPEQYQTVYADEAGSSAAPTAGLHFTPGLFDKLDSKGITIEKVTLHVGRGTFLDVKAEQIKDHVMHSEYYRLEAPVAERLNMAKAEGRRIIAVGTTSVRVLESCAKGGRLEAANAATDIFIHPGYEWKYVDAMITNFHLPKSTLLMLVSAFAGKDFAMDAYKQAIAEKYRFYSFGDAMLIE